MKLIKFVKADYGTLKSLIKISFILVSAYFLFLFIKEKIDILSFLHLIFLFFINFYLFHIYLSSKKEENYIPIYPMIILFYLVTYSGYFLFTQDMVDMSRIHFIAFEPESLLQLDSIHYVVFLIYLGLTFFSIGYFLPNYFNIRNKPFNLVEVNKYEIPLILVFTIFVIFYYINYYNRFVSLSLLNQLKSPIMLFLLAFFVIKYSATKKIIFLILFLITFFPLFIIETSFGATVFPFMLVAIAFLVNFHNTKKINIISVIFVVICIFTIHSMKYELRKATWIFDNEIAKAEKDIENKNKEMYPDKKIGLNFSEMKANIDSFITEEDLKDPAKFSARGYIDTYHLNPLTDKVYQVKENDEGKNEFVEVIGNRNYVNVNSFITEEDLKDPAKFFKEGIRAYHFDPLNSKIYEAQKVDEGEIIFVEISEPIILNRKELAQLLITQQRNEDSQLKIGDSIILENVRTTFAIADSWLLKGKKTINTKDHLSGQQNRLLHSNKSLQIVITKTPRNVDFFNGRSYQTIIYKIIPRFLWRNKPSEEWGNFWGKRYHVLSPKDFHTSWNLPIMNEFYANFGLKGLVVGMFILGLIIKTLLLVLQSDIRNPIILSACSTIMLNFFYQESNLSLLLGKVINQTVFFVVIIFGIVITDILIKKIIK
ncbi:hypothetical protein N9517_05030 [Candidatus Pelagibacter sp.]|nr:hypothetical protein [Candidatus Pelagibacter sp.]